MIEAWCIALAIPPKSPPDGRRRRAKMPPAVSPRVTALLRPRPTQRCRSTPTAGWMIRASQTIPITPRTSPPNTKWKLPSALKSEGTHQKLSPRADPPQLIATMRGRSPQRAKLTSEIPTTRLNDFFISCPLVMLPYFFLDVRDAQPAVETDLSESSATTAADF